jgi:hypothetical protein
MLGRDCEASIAKLSQAIEMKKLEEYTERHHGEAMKLGGQSLDVGKQGRNWAKVAGIAGIVAVAIGAVALGVQIYFSTNPPAPTATPSQSSSPQTTATISALPESAVNSNIATPSPAPTEKIRPPGPP